VLRHIIIGAAIAVLTCLPPTAVDPPATSQDAAGLSGAQIAESTSCASACQAAHDRCRVLRKGSPSCDAERQGCLEKCLQKRR
jgi:hypothetical protein